jgi:hypothetical protein
MSKMRHALTRQQIGEKVTTKQAAREAAKQEFLRARGEYLKDVAIVTQTHDQQAELRASIKQHEDNMKGIEAGWVRDGQYRDFTNETQRAAQKRTLQETDEGFRALCAIRDEAVHMMSLNEATIRDAEYRIRLARYDMEWSITEGRMIAGEDDERHQR